MLPLKILTWNVEHFYGGGGSDTATRQKRRNRLKRIVEYLKEEDPDVFGISEVSSGFVYQAMVEAFPNHTFNITTGQQSQQILIGVRSGLGAFFTQKDEFKRNNIYLRPGALLTVHDNGVHIPILFVHLKSMTAPEGFGLRDAMYERIFSLKNALDDAAQAMTGNDDESANFIVLGDYNTMGMKYYRNIGNISQSSRPHVRIGLHQLQHGADILRDSQTAKNRCLLRQITQPHDCAPIEGKMGDVRAVKHHPAGIGFHQAEHAVEGCRLARAIGSEQSDDLSLPYLETDPAQHRTKPIGLAKIDRFERGTSIRIGACSLWPLKVIAPLQRHLMHMTLDDRLTDLEH